jgi:hypothetical protein
MCQMKVVAAQAAPPQIDIIVLEKNTSSMSLCFPAPTPLRLGHKFSTIHHPPSNLTPHYHWTGLPTPLQEEGVRNGKDQQAKHALFVEHKAKAMVNSDRQARAAVRVALARSAGDSPCATRRNVQEGLSGVSTGVVRGGGAGPKTRRMPWRSVRGMRTDGGRPRSW